MEFSEEKLIDLVSENDDDAKNYLYEKYNYIIDIILAKYKNIIYTLGIDMAEIRQEAMVAFSDALIRYVDNMDTSLPTFISVLVERRVQNCIRKADTIKNKINRSNYSLEYDYAAFKRPLEELLGSSINDPLIRLENDEHYEELKKKIEDSLSQFENDVYKLMLNDFNYLDIARILNKEPKQIDNTIQRIRNKIKDLL